MISTQETQNNGGVQSSETTVYAYDAMNRTSSITKNGTVTSFAYDENNRRISKSSGTQCTLFVLNNDQLLFETNAENNSQNNYYIFGIGGEAEGMLKNGKPYANTLDLTGNVVNSTNLTTQTETESKYDAFGNITEGQTVSSIGYSGEYLDAETGLYYLTARFYDPETGRFTQEDDWLTEGPNLYIYCRNNPVMYSDPSGHCSAIDLVYYRRRGDMAKLEKLKRIIANGECDPKYHYDPSKPVDIFIKQTYPITEDQYNQIKNSIFNRKFKNLFGLSKSGYKMNPSTTSGSIQLFSSTYYDKGGFFNSPGWQGITYVFITNTVAVWKLYIETINFSDTSFMNTLRRFFESDLYEYASFAVDELVQSYTDIPNIGSGFGVLFNCIDSIGEVIIDPFSRYISGAI